MARSTRKHSTNALLVIACLAGLAAPTQAAAVHIWTSTATAGALWSDALNWGTTGAPVDGDSLQFKPPVTGGTRTTTNDLTNLLVSGIDVPANLYVLNGNAIRLDGNISFSADNNSTLGINTPMALQRDVTIDILRTSTTQTPILSTGADISGAFGVTKTGGGQLAINTSTTYTGDTRVSGGNLYLRTGVIYSGATKGNLTIDTGASVLSNNLAFSINGLAGGGGLSKSGTNSRTVSIGNGNGSATYDGSVSWTGGASTVAKDGTGTELFSSTSTMTAPVLAANAGRLIVDGSFTGAAQTNVAAAGTLGGTGTLAAVTVTGALKPGGTLSGDSTAVLGTTTLTLNSTAVTTLDIIGLARESQYDGVDISTALTYGGTLNVTGATAGTFDLFNFAAVVPTGSFTAVNVNGVALTNTAGVWTGTIGSNSAVFSQATGDLLVTVPEPTTLGLLAGVAMVGLRRRRSAR